MVRGIIHFKDFMKVGGPLTFIYMIDDRTDPVASVFLKMRQGMEKLINSLSGYSSPAWKNFTNRSPSELA